MYRDKCAAGSKTRSQTNRFGRQKRQTVFLLQAFQPQALQGSGLGTLRARAWSALSVSFPTRAFLSGGQHKIFCKWVRSTCLGTFANHCYQVLTRWVPFYRKVPDTIGRGSVEHVVSDVMSTEFLFQNNSTVHLGRGRLFLAQIPSGGLFLFMI